MNEAPTLLVPVDLADCTDDIVERAYRLAEVNGAKVVLLHVTQVPEGMASDTLIRRPGSDGTSSAASLLLEEARPELQRYVATLTARGLEAAGRVELGRPVEVILAVADELGPDLIVMGTHDRTGLNRLLMGSVADSIKQRAPCPVVTVHSERRPECGATSCASCDRHVSPVSRALASETDG